MKEMMPKNFTTGAMPFQAMNINFDSKTGQFKIEPMNQEKNEVQQNFMDAMNGESEK